MIRHEVAGNTFYFRSSVCYLLALQLDFVNRLLPAVHAFLGELLTITNY